MAWCSLIAQFCVVGVLGTRSTDQAIRVPAGGKDWYEIYTYALSDSHKAQSVEIDLDILATRTNWFGQILDMYPNVIPSAYEVNVSLVGEVNRTVYHSTFHSNDATISTIVHLDRGAGASEVVVLFRNLNSVFDVSASVNGKVVSSLNQFDLRTQYPTCPFPVYSQQMCGACYADVVAGAGTDALCLNNGGKAVVAKLSPQPILSCASLGGCGGGSPYLATQWTQVHGLVESNQCPFASGSCGPFDDVNGNGCIACSAISIFPGNVAAYTFRPIVLTPNSEYAIRKHLESHGSVMVIFDAHANFQPYFSKKPFAVYSSTESTPSLGNHAVRLIGFGIEQDIPYWIALNSWGESWGNKGSFKIERGRNLCMIEQYPVGISPLSSTVGVNAGIPQESGDNTSEVHQSAGAWREQDPNAPFWKKLIETNRGVFTHSAEFKVTSLSTKLVHDGYITRLTLEVNGQHEEVLIHVSSDGTLSPGQDHGKSRREVSPERLSDTVLAS